MTTDLDRLSRRLHDIETEVRALRQPQLGNSSFEDGSIDEYADDALVQIIGEQYDGTHGSVTMNGPTPPTPTAPHLTPVTEGLAVRWDGRFTDDSVAPLNFARVDLHLSRDPLVYENDPMTVDTLVASVNTARGGQVFVPLSADEHYAWAVCWNAAGRYSEVSEVSWATPNELELTLPEPVQPDRSPEISATGLAESVFIEAETLPAGDLVVYHVSVDPDFVPSAATALNEPTRSNVFVVANLPSGDMLEPNTTYHFRAVATNSAGDAPDPSPLASARLDLTAVERITASSLRAGFALLGALQVGLIEITPDGGIVIPQPDGGTITFPSDGTEALITAGVIARKFTLEGDGVFLGTSKIFGRFRLENGVTNPENEPTVTLFNESITTGLVNEEHRNLITGLAQRSPEAWVAIRPLSTGQGGRLYFLDSTLQDVGSSPLQGDVEWTPRGGVTAINGTLYGLGVTSPPRGSFAEPAWTIRTITSAGITTHFAGVAPEYVFDREPTIGRNAEGTRILVAGSEDATANGRYTLRTWTTAGVSNPSETRVFVSDSDIPFNLNGVEAGTFDYGGEELVALTARGGTTRVFSASSGNMVSLFYSAIGSAAVRGFLWDAEEDAFRQLDSEGRLFKMGKNRTDATLDLAYAWHDPMGADTHTTMRSPIKTVDVRARALVRVEGDPAPDVNNEDATNLDKATSIAIYAAPTGQPTTRQAVLPIGQRSGIVEVLTTTGPVPPLSNEFEDAGATPGIWESAAADGRGPMARFSGAGIWRLGDLSGEADGQVNVGGSWPIAAYVVGEGFASTTSGATDGLVTITHNLGLPPGEAAQRLVTTPRNMLGFRTIQTVSTDANSFTVRAYAEDGSVAMGAQMRFDWHILLSTSALPRG